MLLFTTRNSYGWPVRTGGDMIKIPFVTKIFKTFALEWWFIVTHHRSNDIMSSKSQLQYDDDTRCHSAFHVLHFQTVHNNNLNFKSIRAFTLTSIYIYTELHAYLTLQLLCSSVVRALHRNRRGVGLPYRRT